MAGLPVEITIANPDPAAAPTTFQAAINLLRTLFSAVVTGNYLPYIIGFTTPSVDDQDKIWLKLEGTFGRPMGFFKFYNGNWRKVYDHGPFALMFYHGNPATVFDVTGLGIIGGNWDGWALCNGANGTPNMTDQFICCAHMDSSEGIVPFAGGWQTEQGEIVSRTGGSIGFTSNAANTYAAPQTGVQMANWQADGNTPNPAAGLYGVGTGITIVPPEAGNTSPPQIITLPPFIVSAPVLFVGYD